MAKKGIFTRRPIITGYGRTTGYSHALKLNPAKVDPNFDSTPASPKQPVTTLPKGGKKTFLVTGAKDFEFTEGHEKQLVRNFRNFEKKYGSAQIAHDYNPSNKTSAFVARVAKKYNLPTMEDRPISHSDYNPDPNKKEGYKNREIARQKGVDAGKVFRVSYSRKGKLSAVAPDRLERDNWRNRLGEIKKEGRWRSLKFNKRSKNTQAYKPINALMDEISDHPVGSAKREAGLGYLREYNEDLKTRLNRPSADVTDFLYRQEEGSLPKGAKLRFEVDDIQSEPKPKTKVLVQKPKPPWSRAYFAKTPGLGKPKIVKVPDSSDTIERRYVEKFEDAYDEGTISDNVKDKKKFKPASKTILTGTKQENIKLATKKTGPDAYGSSSLTQFGQGLEEPKNVSEHLEIEGESKDDTSWTKDKERKQNKGWDRHQKNWAEQQDIEIKKDLKNIEEQKPIYKSIERQNKKLKKAGKPLITGKTLLTRDTDPYKWDRQSKTLEHISDVNMPKETKAEKTAKIQAKVKEGAFGGRAKHGQLKYRPPVRGASAPLKALTPFILGGGALQMLPNEAFGERAAQDMERANRRGGGGKKPFHLRKRVVPLTKLSAKKYRRYA
jgi:hypothetical protein